MMCMVGLTGPLPGSICIPPIQAAPQTRCLSVGADSQLGRATAGVLRFAPPGSVYIPPIQAGPHAQGDGDVHERSSSELTDPPSKLPSRGRLLGLGPWSTRMCGTVGRGGVAKPLSPGPSRTRAGEAIPPARGRWSPPLCSNLGSLGRPSFFVGLFGGRSRGRPPPGTIAPAPAASDEADAASDPHKSNDDDATSNTGPEPGSPG